MQPLPRQRAATAKRVDENRGPAVALAASSTRYGQQPLYTDHEYKLVLTAKRLHKDTTDSCQRALRVATETAQVAQGTLDGLYQQGQQIERAAHGVEQIDEDVKHAGRILAFMSRFCCFRNNWADPDLHRDAQRGAAVQRQRMAGVVAAQDAASLYAAKQQVVGAAVAKRSSSAAAAAAATAGGGWAASGSPRIAAQAAPAAAGAAGEARLGYGLHHSDRAELAAETAVQDRCLGQIDDALGALHAMSLAMGQELEEQAPKLDDLQLRTSQTGAALSGVAGGTGKLVGRVRRQPSGDAEGSWRGDQAAATVAVARAVQASAPVARRWGVR